MEEKLPGKVAVPNWELFCLPPSKTWSTGLTSYSFCSFSYSELVYLIHSLPKLPPRAAPTMTGATFRPLESILFFIPSLIQPKGGKVMQGEATPFISPTDVVGRGSRKTFRCGDLLQSPPAQGSVHSSWQISSPQCSWGCPYHLQFIQNGKLHLPGLVCTQELSLLWVRSLCPFKNVFYYDSCSGWNWRNMRRVSSSFSPLSARQIKAAVSGVSSWIFFPYPFEALCMQTQSNYTVIDYMIALPGVTFY